MKFSTAAQYGKALRQKPVSFWQEEGIRDALSLFHEAAQRVPAYADFLKKNRVRAKKIATIKDFTQVPATTKENYILEYPLSARSWDGDLKGHSILAMSSGTSGTPTIWPRGKEQESEASLIHHMLFTELFNIDTQHTLMIIGFPMGVYVSGIATTLSAFATAIQHPNLTIATVGNNKDAVLSLIKKMHLDFSQIVIVGHPFFVKDILETGKSEGILWDAQRVRALFCSEGFSEAWRSYVANLIQQDPAYSLFNTYGSSEFLLMGYENPFTITLRQMAEKDSSLCERIFSGPSAHNLFQYDPRIRYIETEGDDLLVTARCGIPLIRFNQHDAGSVTSYAALTEQLAPWQSAIDDKLQSLTWSPWRLPFVTLKGRSDRTLIFYAANIYPEHILAALSDAAYFGKLTGKFVMKKKYLKNMDQVLEINIELRPGVLANKAFAMRLQKSIVTGLEHINMEYRYLRQNLDKDIVPHIILKTYQDPRYFKPDLKPRYIATS